MMRPEDFMIAGRIISLSPGGQPAPGPLIFTESATLTQIIWPMKAQPIARKQGIVDTTKVGLSRHPWDSLMAVATPMT
eukprot:4379847-Alexandrium_andersonii.AAC.1